MDTKSLAEALAEKIGDGKPYTQQGAADEMGTSKENVNRWMNGTVPDPPFYEPLEQFLEIDRAELGSMIMETSIRRWEARKQPR